MRQTMTRGGWVGWLVGAALGVTGSASVAQPVGPPPGAAIEETVTGAPFSATLEMEFRHRLADGTEVVRHAQGVVARDSQGRTRRDYPVMGPMPFGDASQALAVVIRDPQQHATWSLDPDRRVARKLPFADPPFARAPASGQVAGRPGAGAPGPGGRGPGRPGPGGFREQGPPWRGGGPANGGPGLNARRDTLGTQVIEGVSAEGMRLTRTIPVGQLGNDRAVTVVIERWTATDLRTAVREERRDPRLGDSVMRLTNVVREEPPAALFEIPADYQRIDFGPVPGPGGPPRR